MNKFKVGDKVIVVNLDCTRAINLSSTGVKKRWVNTGEILSIVKIDHADNSLLLASYDTSQWIHYRDIRIVKKDNDINRLLYPELKPDGKGHLI